MPALPWFKFNAGDWRSDESLRMCSLAARGLWIEMLCVMHKSDPRGYLMVSGTPVTLVKLAELAGCSCEQASELLAELARFAVFSVKADGTIYSRRMVREARRSETNSENARHRYIDNTVENAGRIANSAATMAATRAANSAAKTLRPISESRDQKDSDSSSLRSSESPRSVFDEIRAIEDPGKKAWRAMELVFTDLGSMTVQRAKTMIGKLKRDTGARDDELFQAAEVTWTEGTRDPVPFVVATLEGIVERRGKASNGHDAEQHDPAAWMAKQDIQAQATLVRHWQETGDWSPAALGPAPDQPGTHINERVLTALKIGAQPAPPDIPDEFA